MSGPTKALAKSEITILIVENHPDTLRYMQIYLAKTGYRILTASTMQEGLQRLREEPCDILVSDIGLPDGDGWQLLRESGLSSRVYAIAMTGFGLDNDLQQSTAAGFRHHLRKPFSPDQLDRYLEEAEREIAAHK